MFKLHHHSLTEEETSRCSTLFPPPLSHKLLLLSEHLGLYYDVIDTLCEHSEQIDSELCSLLCLRELLPHLINTGVYPHLIRYVLTQVNFLVVLEGIGWRQEKGSGLAAGCFLKPFFKGKNFAVE